jgi:hypothetical protein
VYKYHILLIHSLVVGHLGCFHSLAIVNSAAINMGIQMPLEQSELYSLGISLGVVLLDCISDLCLVL